VRTLDIDTEVASYLLDPAESGYLLQDLAAPLRRPRAEGGDGRHPTGDARPRRGRGRPRRGHGPLRRRRGRLAPAVTDALVKQGLRDLYDQIERPLVRVLARMEIAGVGVDAAELQALNERLATEATMLEARIQAEAGVEFKVNSTPQLRTVLFETLGLAPNKKTKTGFSTDAASLEKLQGQHPVIDSLLRYRAVEKLRSTYGTGLLAEVDPGDGRIHATFQQTVARTGRLSSDQPNLHNIPVRTEEGRQFRRAFVPAPGFELLVADYNQIELRVIAHLADDPGLIGAFTAGEDIHTATAARVFGVEPPAVTSEQRAKAKMVSYGLAYGMESYGLATRLSIPVAEAQVILDAYFAAFPNVRDYMDRTVQEARQRGYTETLMGRRRPIPELSSPNVRIRQAGERQAMNAGIQGLAADIFKVALVALDAALEEEGVRSRLILQVHDEVILEVPPEEHDAMADLVPQVMGGACDLQVPARRQPLVRPHVGRREGLGATAARRSAGGRRCGGRCPAASRSPAVRPGAAGRRRPPRRGTLTSP
jgi:DNA polymerase-1